MLVNEIFSSINGEVCFEYQGSLCTFIRLAGCNFAEHPCKWCDTPRSLRKESGVSMTIEDIMHKVMEHKNENVTITGGEPLCQEKELRKLIKELHLVDKSVSIETNGSFEIPDWRHLGWISWVVDYKLPSSGNEGHMNIKNFRNLDGGDFVKFVVTDRRDFDRAVIVYKELAKNLCVTPVFSPCPIENANELHEWMQGENLLKAVGAILSVQIHKMFNLR